MVGVIVGLSLIIGALLASIGFLGGQVIAAKLPN